MGDTGYIRVYFSDGSWTTVRVSTSTTVWQICEDIAKKRNLHPANSPTAAALAANQIKENRKKYADLDDNIHQIQEPTTPPKHIQAQLSALSTSSSSSTYGLYVFDSVRDRVFERRLLDNERPLEIQESVRKHGQLEHFQFFFKVTHDLEAEEREIEEDTSDDEEEIYLQQKRQFNCSHCGYLDKRGQGGRGTQWKQRWFILQGEKLLYFKHHTSTTPISYIPVGDAIISPLSLISALSLYETPPSSTPYVFEINTHQRIFYLRAANQSSMKKWIIELKNQTHVERENFVMDQCQFALDNIATEESETDEKRRLLMLAGVDGVLADAYGSDWLCKIAMEEKRTEELLCYMDIAVWFYINKQIEFINAYKKEKRQNSHQSNGNTTTNNSASPAKVVSPPPPSLARTLSNHISNRFLRSSSVSSIVTAPPKHHRHALYTPLPYSPPSSYLPGLSSRLIFDRYIEKGSEMEVHISDELRDRVRQGLRQGERERANKKELKREISASSDSANDEEDEDDEDDDDDDHTDDGLNSSSDDVSSVEKILLDEPVKGGTFFQHHPYNYLLQHQRESSRRLAESMSSHSSGHSQAIDRRASMTIGVTPAALKRRGSVLGITGESDLSSGHSSNSHSGNSSGGHSGRTKITRTENRRLSVGDKLERRGSMGALQSPNRKHNSQTIRQR